MSNFIYQLTPKFGDGNSIRDFHEVRLPDNQIGALPFGKFAYGDETWGDGVTEYWLRVLEMNDAPVARESWIAGIHKGKTVAFITKIGLPIPPPAAIKPKPITVLAEIGDDEKIYVTINDPNNLPVGFVTVNGLEYVKA